MREYLEDLFSDRLPIILMKRGGVISEPYIPDFPDEPIDTVYFEQNESFDVRYWSGQKKNAQQVGDGDALEAV